MIRTLIIEDEAIAYRNLLGMLDNNQEDFKVESWLQSIASAQEWLKQNPCPDLIFLDVHLSDGLSFSISELNKVECPIIFTTANEEHALKAFELDSIDYLLKPFSQDQLDSAILKYKKRNLISIGKLEMEKILFALKDRSPQYKDRFHVKRGKRLVVVQTKDIAWFHLNTYVYLMTKAGDKFMLDYSLDQILNQLDPQKFYRLNRQFIANIDSIINMETHFNYKIKITLKPESESTVFVAKDNAKEFKEWLG